MTKSNDVKLWGKARVEALSDGIFAIAITLLVLEIRLPELPHGAPNAEIWHAVRSIGPVFISFLITFVLAGSFWFMHHTTFHSVKYVTRSFTAINLLFLMFVTILPFSTGLIGRLGPNHPVALTIYFTNQLALGLSLNVLWYWAERQQLIEHPIPDPAVRFMIGFQPVACVAALVTVGVSPIASYYVFGLAMVVARRISRRKYKSLPANAPAPL